LNNSPVKSVVNKEKSYPKYQNQFGKESNGKRKVKVPAIKREREVDTVLIP